MKGPQLKAKNSWFCYPWMIGLRTPVDNKIYTLVNPFCKIMKYLDSRHILPCILSKSSLTYLECLMQCK